MRCSMLLRRCMAAANGRFPSSSSSHVASSVVSSFESLEPSTSERLPAGAFHPAPEWAMRKNVANHLSGNAPSGRRWASSSASTEQQQELKSALRDLYRLVHPDFFHDWPAERAVNEKSFALLQEYLSAASEGGGGRESAGGAFRFVFYLRNCPRTGRPGGMKPGVIQPDGVEPQDEAAAVAATAAEEPDGAQPFAGAAETEEVVEGLFRVDVSLPPPPRGWGGVAGQNIINASLGRLLSSVGLQSDITLGSGGGGLSYGGSGGGFSYGGSAGGGRPLQRIIEINAEAVRRSESRLRGLAAQMALARTALQLGRRVQFSVSSGAAKPLSGEEELNMYMRFAGACDLLEDVDLAGLKVALGTGGFGVDAAGVLWLDARQGEEAWAAWLRDHVGESRARAAAIKELRGREASVASALGLGMVFATQALSSSPEYSRFLEAIVKAAAANGPVGGESRPFSSVPLCAVGPAAPGAAGGGAAASFELSPLGLLFVPVSASPEELYEFVAAEGGTASEILARVAREEQEVKALVEKVRKRLRLRHLLRDKQLPLENFSACCHQLMRNCSALSHVMEGLSICVSDEHGVTEDGSMVTLRWNYEM